MKAQRPPRSEFPMVLKQGSSEVKIYETPVTVSGKAYSQYALCYWLGGKRVRQRFSDLDKAKAEAQAAVIKLANADGEALRLLPSDRAVYVQALELLRPLAKPLNLAVDEYVSAANRLPPGVSLAEVVSDYLRRHPSTMVRRTVKEVAAELIADQKARGSSGVHLRDLESRLGRFAETFQAPIATLTAPQIRDYLRKLTAVDGKPVKNRTRRNVQRILSTFFNFARKQKFVTRELCDEIAEIEAPKVENTEIGIFKPEQLRAILNEAADDILPAICIAAFCGLRTAELQRLDWENVRLAERVLIVGADQAKTSSRRVVSIPENCANWLAPLVRESGSVSPSPTDRALNHRIARTAARVGISWVKNGLRHSFCSYLLAATHDPAKVATQAGHSASMLHKNYKALVTQAQGEAWFAIHPDFGALNAFTLPGRISM